MHYINCQYFIYIMKNRRISLVLLSISTTQTKMTVKTVNTDSLLKLEIPNRT
jgi:hypothetical protein